MMRLPGSSRQGRKLGRDSPKLGFLVVSTFANGVHLRKVLQVNLKSAVISFPFHMGETIR